MRMPLHKKLSRITRGYFRSRILAEHGIGVAASTKNGLLIVDPGDFNVSRKLLTKGEYDWREVELLSSLVNAQSKIVFVGAHVGALVVPILRTSGARSAIAYEPSPRNFRLLLMNLSLNGIDGSIAKNIAMGEQSGALRFTENRINTGNSRISKTTGEIEVPVDTLDRTLPSEWDTIDLMVMDVEGSEVAAMRGAVKTLQKTRFLYVEFAPEQLEEQGATAAEFIDRVADNFASGYVVDGEMRHRPIQELRKHLLELPKRRGLLLNLLLSKETQPFL